MRLLDVNARDEDDTPGRGNAVRSDLDDETLLGLFVFGVVAAVGVLAFARGALPGVPIRQGAAIAGSILLVIPFAFALAKRSGLSSNPPGWYVAHVLCSTLGVILICVHAAGGAYQSPAVALLALLLALFVQGFYLRLVVAKRLSRTFSTRVKAFAPSVHDRRAELRDLIEQKRALLVRLDPDADEALFSPTLLHWCRHPRLTSQYQRLANAEGSLVRMHATAGTAPTARARYIHIILAALFAAGLLLHVILATFFAGYVAGPRAVYWWHVSTWGGL